MAPWAWVTNPGTPGSEGVEVEAGGQRFTVGRSLLAPAPAPPPAAAPGAAGGPRPQGIPQQDQAVPGPDQQAFETAEPPAPAAPAPGEGDALRPSSQDGAAASLISFDDFEAGGAPVAAPDPEAAAKVEEAAAAVEPEPSDPQKEAGNYRKGHVRWGGLDISIENAKGGTRRGTDAEGRPWEVEMPAHYGYIRRTEGADGDQVDAYIGDGPEDSPVFVIDQVDAESGAFDEHKVVLGTAGRDEALALYSAGFSDGRGPDRIGGVREMTREEFRSWLDEGDQSAPAADGAASARPAGPEIVAAVGDDGAPVAPAVKINRVGRDGMTDAERGGPLEDVSTAAATAAPEQDFAAQFRALPADPDAWDGLRARLIEQNPDRAAEILDAQDAAGGRPDPDRARRDAADAERVARMHGKLDTLQARLREGREARLRTGTNRITPISNPDDLRATSDGVQMREGRRWVNLFDSQVDDLLGSVGGAERPVTAEAATAPTEQPADAESPLRIRDFSEKSIIVEGQTRENLDRIKTAIGRRPLWNKKAKGWVFRKSDEAKVREALADLLGARPAATQEAQQQTAGNIEPVLTGINQQMPGGYSVQFRPGTGYGLVDPSGGFHPWAPPGTNAGAIQVEGKKMLAEAERRARQGVDVDRPGPTDDGIVVHSARRTRGDETTFGKWTAIAVRDKPFSTERGYGETEAEAAASARRQIKPPAEAVDRGPAWYRNLTPADRRQGFQKAGYSEAEAGRLNKVLWPHLKPQDRERLRAAVQEDGQQSPLRPNDPRLADIVRDSQAIAQGRLPVEDDRARQRAENIRKMREIYPEGYPVTDEIAAGGASPEMRDWLAQASDADLVSARDLSGSGLVGSIIEREQQRRSASPQRQRANIGGEASGVVFESSNPEIFDAVVSQFPDAEGVSPESPAARPSMDDLRAYADRIVAGANVARVWLVGSSAVEGAVPNDTDILYEMDAEPTVEGVTAAIEAAEIDLDAYDTFVKAGDRHFVVQSGAGREVVENTDYARAQEGRPRVLLAERAGPAGRAPAAPRTYAAREDYPVIDEGPDAHPIVKAMNEVRRWHNRLSDADYEALRERFSSTGPGSFPFPASIGNLNAAEDMERAQQTWQRWLDGRQEGPLAPSTGSGRSADADDYGARNKLVTRDRADELARRLRDKLRNQIGAGIDPEILAIGTELAVYHIEAGTRRFTDVARALSDHLGMTVAEIRPYLRAWYNGARDMMEDAGQIVSDMDGPDQVAAAIREIDDGNQSAVPRGDEGARAPDVQPPSANRGDGRAPADDRGRGEPDVPGDDRPRPEGRGGPGEAAAPRGGRGGGEVGADRVPAGRPGGRGPGTGEPGPSAGVTGENFSIEPGALAEERGPKRKAQDNIRAIEIMREIEAAGRLATHAEQEQLALYVGWGGLSGAFPDADGNFAKGFDDIGARLRDLLNDTEYATARRSIQYAHYTSEDVVRAMWSAAQRFGFAGGKVFEPGMGVGNFAGMMPPDVAAGTAYSGLEMDHTTARIARLLYPKWGVRQDDFTRAPLPADTYDLVIGNPPFADVPVTSDPAYKKHRFLLHDYFFAKSLDAVRPGGLLMFISSAGTMNKADTKAREYLAARADLVGAVRLPGNAFARNAGTEVTTDIIVLRKRLEGESAAGDAWTGTAAVQLPNKDGRPTEGLNNRYFVDNPDMVLGDEGFFDKLYAGRYAVRAREGVDLADAMAEAFGRMPANVMSEWRDTTDRAEIDFGTSERKEGSYYLDADGKLMQVRLGVGHAVERRGKGVKGGMSSAEMDRVRDLIPIRDALRAVYGADLADDTENGSAARQRLNEAYDAFVKKYGPINKADLSFRRPSVVEQESARSAAREEARYAGRPFDEGTFDPAPLLDRRASLSEIAAARKEAREQWVAEGRTWSEGDFDPAEMPDKVVDRRPNIDPFALDPESYRLRAIERYDDQTGVATKGSVFRENVITKDRPPEINSIGDALLYVLRQAGGVDLDEIARHAKLSRQQVIEQLGDRIFLEPGTDDSYVVREAYLSGNVLKKLRQARAAAERDPRFRRNVEALEAAQPAPLPPSEISANLGMPWIPPETIEQFGRQHMGLTDLRVRYQPTLAQWTVDGDEQSAAATSTWGTSRRPAPKLLADALNRQQPKVLDTFRDENGRPRNVVNVVDTQAAQEKMAEIKRVFSDWIWADEDRAQDLAGLYNERFNNLVVREYDGSYLTTPGVSSSWSWRPHQTRVVARIVQDGNTYMAHAVGAGKTSAMIGAGMEMRRLGLVRKPMYVVPNHMLGQFAKEFYEQYPTARIAVADDRRFHTDRRKQFIADVASDDLDAIIITHSSFGLIPVSHEFQDGLIQEEIDRFREVLDEIPKDQDGRITRKKIEKQIERMEQRLSGRGSRRKDQVFTFEEMGVDFLFVDESHLFRKLDFSTKMGTVKGISPEGSQASWDLYVKSRYLEARNPGRNLVLASGTPITNTMAELYSLSRYLQPAEMRERGLEQFDAWAGAFGDTVTNLEQDPAGGYKPVTRFARFVNVPELSAMVRQVMDVVTPRQLEQYVTRPALKTGRRIMNLAEKSDALEAYQGDLAARMTAIANRVGPVQKGDDIILSVIGDGRHAAIDMRLVDPSARAETASKLDLLVDNVYEIWRRTKRQPLHLPAEEGGYSAEPHDKGPATQMVFANLGLNAATRGFSVPDYIRAELRRRGVPANQIANIADYKTLVQRQRLFNDMNEGKVRVLIGSTARMGTGVNAQRRLYAVHNLDPLWYPADDEQRNGRILRQGNQNPEIEIHDYSTKGTYDSTMWGLMETKARFIQGFMEGDPNLRDMEDLGEASQYEQAKAISTNDPRLIELTEARQDLERAQRRRSAHDRQVHAARVRVQQAEAGVEYADRAIPQVRSWIEARVDTRGDAFSGMIDGRTYSKRIDFGEALMGSVERLVSAEKPVKDWKIGEIAGFDIVADVRQSGVGDRPWFADLAIEHQGEAVDEFSLGTSALGAVRAIENIPQGLEGRIEYLERAKADDQRAIDEFTPKARAEFTGQEEIDRLREKVDEIESALAAETRAAEAQAAAALDPDEDDNPDLREDDTQPGAGPRQPAGRVDLRDDFEPEVDGIGDDPPARIAAADAWTLRKGEETGAEHLAVLDADGAVIEAGTSGLADGLHYGPDAAARLSDPAAGMTVVHNHPGGTSLSGQDISQLALPGVARIRAVSGTGEYEASAVPGVDLGDPELLGERLGRIAGMLMDRVEVAVVDGALEEDAVVQHFKHAVNVLLNRIGVIRYEAAFKGDPAPAALLDLVEQALPQARVYARNHFANLTEQDDGQDGGNDSGLAEPLLSARGVGGVRGDGPPAGPGRARGAGGAEGDRGVAGQPDRSAQDPGGGRGDEVGRPDGGTTKRQAAAGPPPPTILTPDGERAARAALDALRRIAPGAPTRLFSRIADESGRPRAYGAYANGIISLALEAPNPPGTARHEAIHFLRETGALGNLHWRPLEAAAREQDWVARYRIRDRYRDPETGEDRLTGDEMIEEAVADAYAEWATGARDAADTPTRVQRAFAALRRIFERVRGAIREKLGRDPDYRDLFSRVETGRQARETTDRPSTGSPFADMLLRARARLVPAYHGSPHDFDRFSTEKIGTGEGNQAYGWGLYFASLKEIANTYRHTLSARNRGVIVDGERITPPRRIEQAGARERAAIFAARPVGGLRGCAYSYAQRCRVHRASGAHCSRVPRDIDVVPKGRWLGRRRYAGGGGAHPLVVARPRCAPGQGPHLRNRTQRRRIPPPRLGQAAVRAERVCAGAAGESGRSRCSRPSSRHGRPAGGRTGA